MPRIVIPTALLASLALLQSILTAQPPAGALQSPLQWIWTPEAKQTSSLPAGARWFRKTFTINRPIANPVDEAVIEITADNEFQLWFNGVEIGNGNQWQRMYRFDVKKQAVHGNNTIAVEAKNESPGPAGLLVHATFIPNGKTREAVPCDESWKCTQTQPPAAWQKSDFQDQDWQPAHPLGSYGGTQPWGMIQWDSAPTGSRFTVPQGFIVETVIPPHPNAPALNSRLPFSLINMTFDAKGRLLVSQERGPILLCTQADSHGVLQSIRPYCKQVKNAQGLCWVRDALLVVGDGPQGTGLYRAKDTKGQDETDEVTLLHKFKGEMGEHGPHAIIHGPDDWLYMVIGNHAWAQPDRLADNSPLLRWPKGTFGPDQGKPDTTEDVLLPRLNDGRGHAANILAPGGTIWRMDHQGKNLGLVAAGFRNHFDAAFRADGELFTFDSDMEWDEGMPWYRPVRVCHCPPGADFLWRTGAANTPNYYLDSLPPLAETGRGSPVGVACYEHHRFPARYQGTLFLGDWSQGIIWAVTPRPSSSTFQGTPEKFCVGAPLNVTDLEVGPSGDLYFTLGGRGTAGGVYRIRYTGSEKLTQGDQPLSAWSSTRNQWHNPQEQPPSAESCIAKLKSANPREQRHACEDLIRFGYEPPLESLWPLFSHADPYLRTAARLVLQRINPDKWMDRLRQSDDLPALEAIVALCKIQEAKHHSRDIYERLSRLSHTQDADTLLRHLRAWQLAFIHAPVDDSMPLVTAAINRWLEMFPRRDSRINRELAILLTHARRVGWTATSAQEKILGELVRAGQDRQQQIYFFYCLRLLHDGWTPEQKEKLISWFDATADWSGGHSFTPFMENIFKDWAKALSAAEKISLLTQPDHHPHTVAVLSQTAADLLDAQQAIAAYVVLAGRRGESAQNGRQAILSKLGKSLSDSKTQQALRRLADQFPEQAEMVARTLAKAPNRENLPYLLRGLASTSPLVLRDCMAAIKKIDFQPAPEEGGPYRSVLLAVGRLNDRDRPLALELLRRWKPQRFSSDEGDLKTELTGWTRWFGQAFPKEPPLPDAATLTAESKWKLDDLRAALDKTTFGDPKRGELIFTKANCIKCHKFGSQGEGIGPDLTTLKSRFQRADILEAMLSPSKTISDQYRGSVIITTSGQTLTGLAAPQGDAITVLQIDGSKVTVKKSDVESQIASTVSPMPEKLLDDLTLREIIDLMAYLESTPK